MRQQGWCCVLSTEYIYISITLNVNDSILLGYRGIISIINVKGNKQTSQTCCCYYRIGCNLLLYQKQGQMTRSGCLKIKKNVFSYQIISWLIVYYIVLTIALISKEILY